MELLNNKFTVTIDNPNASLTGGWNGAKRAKVFRIKFNETNKHCFVKVYGGSMARINKKDALYCLLSDATDFMDAYGDVEQYLIDNFGYDEFVEDDYGNIKKNPELARVKKGLADQYKRAFNIIEDDDKIIDLYNEFREEYDY